MSLYSGMVCDGYTRTPEYGTILRAHGFDLGDSQSPRLLPPRACDGLGTRGPTSVTLA